MLADWYDEKTMAKLRILDDNTHRYISPLTGGANVPALNDLLRPFGISLGSGVLAGDWGFDRKSTRMVNGVPIIEFPSDVRTSGAPGIFPLRPHVATVSFLSAFQPAGPLNRHGVF